MYLEIGFGDAVASLCPNAHWSIEGDDLSMLNWFSADIERPSDDEILAELERLKLARLVALEEAEAARANALSKLAAIGLTEEDLKNVIGL